MCAGDPSASMHKARIPQHGQDDKTPHVCAEARIPPATTNDACSTCADGRPDTTDSHPDTKRRAEPALTRRNHQKPFQNRAQTLSTPGRGPSPDRRRILRACRAPRRYDAFIGRACQATPQSAACPAQTCARRRGPLTTHALRCTPGQTRPAGPNHDGAVRRGGRSQRRPAATRRGMRAPRAGHACG